MNIVRLTRQKGIDWLVQKLDGEDRWSTLEHFPTSATSADNLKGLVKGEIRRVEKYFGPCKFVDEIN